MLFQRSHSYVGAADLPWYASKGNAKDALEEEGFSNVRVYDKGDPRAPDIEPPNRRSYNALATLFWPGPDTEFELPEEVVWVVDITTPEEEPIPLPPPRRLTPEEEFRRRGEEAPGVPTPLTPEELAPTPIESWALVATLFLATGVGLAIYWRRRP